MVELGAVTHVPGPGEQLSARVRLSGLPVFQGRYHVTAGGAQRIARGPRALNAWGATPVPYDWRQTCQGLQAGVVEGLYVPIPYQYLFKMHEIAKFYTETGGIWSGAHLSMDLGQYDALSAEEKAALHKGVEAFDEIARSRGLAWVIEETNNLKAEITEWHKPTVEEMSLWRAGAVQAWKDAKAAFDGERAERALMEQGLDDFIATLKKAGAL